MSARSAASFLVAMAAAAMVALAPKNVLAQSSEAESRRLANIVNSASHAFLATHAGTVGMSLGILYRGNAYRFNFGTLAHGTQAQATADTRYPIASITKTFTAALLAHAAVDGKLGITDDVRKHLKGTYSNLVFNGRPIRLFDLLDHRSGLPFFLPDKPEAQPDDSQNAIPFLTRLATLKTGYDRRHFFLDLHSVKLQAPPGSEPPHYSNAGAELIGYILEDTYAEPFNTLLQQNILSPLGMRSTCMAASCKPAGSLPEGYDRAGHRLPDDTAPLGPAGALQSTVNDLLKYMAWQHKEADPAVKMSHVPRVTVGDYVVGLNWQMWSSNGNHLLWQSGNVPGFGSLCLDEKEPDIQLVVLMNGTDDATTDGKEALANDILKRLDPRSIPLP